MKGKIFKNIFISLLIIILFGGVVFLSFVNFGHKDNNDNASAATTESRLVIAELEKKQSEVENKVDDLNKKLNDAILNDSINIETIKIELDEMKSELEYIKHELNLLKSNLTKYSNPNLLINGDFRVNQRGQESYSNSCEYTVDRWINRDSSLKITPIKNKGIKIDKVGNTGSVSMLSQSIENFEILLGRTVTLSFKISENTSKLGVGIQIVAGNASYYASYGLGGEAQWAKNDGVFSETLTLPSSIDYSCLNAIIRFDANEDIGASVVVEWVKLEFGDTTTEYNPRLYVEELLLCQRYYQSIMMNSTAAASTSTAIYVPFSLPMTLRSLPILKVIITPSLRGNGQRITNISSIIVNRIETNFVRLLFETTGLVQDEIYASTDGFCTLDAEIY